LADTRLAGVQAIGGGRDVETAIGDRHDVLQLSQFQVAPQTERNASVGSISAAFRAGIQLASRAARQSRIATDTKVSGSVASIPYKRLPMKRVSPAEDASPKPMPSTTSSKVCRSTMALTCPARAPTAMRMPISLVRSAVA